MRLDNSAFTMYMKCGKMYFERYEADAKDVQAVRTDADGGSDNRVLHILQASPSEGVTHGIELIERSRDGLDFGTYFHALADRARKVRILRVGGPELGLEPGERHPGIPERVRDEVAATFAAYEAHWLGNDFEYLESERTHALPLPGSKHELLVKIDAVVRFPDRTIGPLDTKTESKPGYNFREDWAGRTQASLYLWALQVLYPEERVSRLVVDVVTRGSARRAPSFNRLDDISRPQDALDDAIRNVIRACDEIEESRASGWWKSNMNICKDSWKRCDYYDLHVYGRTAENLAKYRPAEAYLDV